MPMTFDGELDLFGDPDPDPPPPRPSSEVRTIGQMGERLDAQAADFILRALDGTSADSLDVDPVEYLQTAAAEYPDAPVSANPRRLARFLAEKGWTAYDVLADDGKGRGTRDALLGPTAGGQAPVRGDAEGSPGRFVRVEPEIAGSRYDPEQVQALAGRRARVSIHNRLNGALGTIVGHSRYAGGDDLDFRPDGAERGTTYPLHLVDSIDVYEGPRNPDGTPWTPADALAMLSDVNQGIADGTIVEPGSRAAAREEARRARREAKADRVEGWAHSRGAEATGRLARAREMADAIPFGQPMMPDHHSYRSDRSYRNRINANYDKGFEAQQMAERHARRAEGIRRWEEERLTAPVTLRRIKTLEAEQRKVKRDLEGRLNYAAGTMTLVPPNPKWAERLRARDADLDDELTYWRAHVAELEASGVKVWGPGDFAKGDRVVAGSWAGTVVRVNKKSLSIRLPEGSFMGGSVKTVPYDKIKANAGPGEMPT